MCIRDSDGTLGLVREQDVDQRAVGELDLAQREPDAVDGVAAEPFGLGAVGAGRGQRVPGARGGVGGLVLGGVEEVGEPAEQPPGLGERGGVARAAGDHGGVGEGRRGGGLGGLGDQQDGSAGPQRALQLALPGGRFEQHTGVETDRRGAAGALPVPPPGDRPGPDRNGAAGEDAVAVLDVVADLHRGERERDGGGEPGAFALGDGGGAHAAQRARPGGAPPGGVLPGGLGLDQHGDDQTVVVGGGPGELSVVVAQCEAEPAQVRHPGGLEPLRQSVLARSDDAEHDRPPRRSGR